MMLAQYPRRQHTTTFVRKFIVDSMACKIPDWARPLIKSSSLQKARKWISSMMYNKRHFMVQKALKPPNFYVQMKAHVWQIIMIQKIMANFGCPARFIAKVRQLSWWHALAWVQNDGEYSESFPITNEVKQGCVLAPTLLSMMFSAMLSDDFQDCNDGFPIRSRFDGTLSNLRGLRLQTKSKVQTDKLTSLSWWHG